MADHRPKSETGRDESSSVSSSMREGPPANAVDTLARGLQIGGRMSRRRGYVPVANAAVPKATLKRTHQITTVE